MNIHEYQAKALLKAYGAPVADGRVAASPQEAADHARALGGDIFVVKAQIHARRCRSFTPKPTASSA